MFPFRYIWPVGFGHFLEYNEAQVLTKGHEGKITASGRTLKHTTHKPEVLFFFLVILNVTFPHLSLSLLSYLFLDGHFHLDPFGVWFCPQEARVNETYLWRERCCWIHEETDDIRANKQYTHSGYGNVHHFHRLNTWIPDITLKDYIA